MQAGRREQGPPRRRVRSFSHPREAALVPGRAFRTGEDPALVAPARMERFFDRFAELAPGAVDPSTFSSLRYKVGIEVLGVPLAQFDPGEAAYASHGKRFGCPWNCIPRPASSLTRMNPCGPFCGGHVMRRAFGFITSRHREGPARHAPNAVAVECVLDDLGVVGREVGPCLVHVPRQPVMTGCPPAMRGGAGMCWSGPEFARPTVVPASGTEYV